MDYGNSIVIFEHKALPGSHIGTVARDAVAFAQKACCDVRFRFNDIEVLVSRAHTAEDVLATYDRLCEESAARWRASPAGIAYMEKRAKELAKKQAEHDHLMITGFPSDAFNSTSEAVLWLSEYAEATNDTGVINQDYPKVVDCLTRSGFIINEFVGEPRDSFTADRTGRWLIGQAMDQMENHNMPPHDNMMHIFSERYFKMLEAENNG
jgi:hypothetical protein